MADQLEQAQVLYRKRHNYSHILSEDDHASLAHSIGRLVHDGLKHQTGVASFRHPAVFADVIRRTVEAGRFQGERAASAFNTLEAYMLLLLAQPWKREFHTLKLYGGFFCTRVKAHLEASERVLSLVGYAPDKSESGTTYRLVLVGALDAELLLTVAFDCLVAATECRLIGERYEKMKCLNLGLTDIMNFLLFEDSSYPHPISSSSPAAAAAPGQLSSSSSFGAPLPLLTAAPGVGVGAPPPALLLDAAGMSSALDPGRVASSSVFATPQTVTAVGGMGFGVVLSAGRGVPAGAIPTPAFSSAAMRHGLNMPPAPSDADSPGAPGRGGLTLRPDMMTRIGSDVSGPPSRPPSIASALASRPAPSSVYMSTSSPYGTGSSGYGTASSVGYGTASSGHASTSAFAADTAAIQRVARPVPLLHHNQYRQHSPQSPALPYADDNPTDVASPASYPEGTQEEHLLESLRNLDASGNEGGAGDRAGKASALLTAADPVAQLSSPAALPVQYDDWRWFPRGQQYSAAPPPPPYCGGVGARGYVQMPPARPNSSQHASANAVRTRFSSQFPAMAVTGLVSQQGGFTNGYNEPQSQAFPPSQPTPHRSSSADYLPALNCTLTRDVTSPGPFSELGLSRAQDRAFSTRDGALGVQARLDAACVLTTTPTANPADAAYFAPSAPSSGGVPPFPLITNDPVYVQRQQGAAALVMGPPSFPQQYPKPNAPSFAEMVDSSRAAAMGSHLLSRQASSSGAVLPSNNLDVLQPASNNLPNPGKGGTGMAGGSSSGIVMREKPATVMSSALSSSSSTTTARVSSLSNPDRSLSKSVSQVASPVGLSRQTSHSMDLGALKWRCRICTMENSALDTVCTMCCKSRAGADVQYPAAGESKLVCPVCTLENSPGCSNCDACNTPLPQGMHTYV